MVCYNKTYIQEGTSIGHITSVQFCMHITVTKSVLLDYGVLLVTFGQYNIYLYDMGKSVLNSMERWPQGNEGSLRGRKLNTLYLAILILNSHVGNVSF